jgi:hypothetical protein
MLTESLFDSVSILSAQRLQRWLTSLAHTPLPPFHFLPLSAAEAWPALGEPGYSWGREGQLHSRSAPHCPGDLGLVIKVPYVSAVSAVKWGWYHLHCRVVRTGTSQM